IPVSWPSGWPGARYWNSGVSCTPCNSRSDYVPVVVNRWRLRSLSCWAVPASIGSAIGNLPAFWHMASRANAALSPPWLPWACNHRRDGSYDQARSLLASERRIKSTRPLHFAMPRLPLPRRGIFILGALRVVQRAPNPITRAHARTPLLGKLRLFDLSP